MGLKRWDPSFAFSGNQVVPGEIDRYEQYIVAFPSASNGWFGTVTVGGTAAVTALTITNAIADYPRNA